jgi:hypothetical protein
VPHERFRPDDTSPEAWRLYLELLRKIPAHERLRQAFEMSETIRRLAEAGVRAKWPNADEREFRFRLAERWIGRRTAEQLYSHE